MSAAPNKEDIVSFCRELHQKGYTPGSSGGLAVLCNFGTNSKSIFVTPEGTYNGSLLPNELFTLRDFYGSQEVVPPLGSSDEGYQISRYATIFLEVLQNTDSSCVAYIPSKWASLVTRMGLKAWSQGASNLPNVVRLSHWGLIGELDPTAHELVIPTINYGSVEVQAAQFSSIRSMHPESIAIFVRNTGMVVWANSFNELRSKIELLERLCELQVTEYHLVGK